MVMMASVLNILAMEAQVAGYVSAKTPFVILPFLPPSQPWPLPNDLHQWHHWLELSPTYETFNGEKNTESATITLTLENFKGSLAQALDVSVSESELGGWGLLLAPQWLQRLSSSQQSSHLPFRHSPDDKGRALLARSLSSTSINFCPIITTRKRNQKEKKTRNQKYGPMDYFTIEFIIMAIDCVPHGCQVIRKTIQGGEGCYASQCYQALQSYNDCRIHFTINFLRWRYLRGTKWLTQTSHVTWSTS